MDNEKLDAIASGILYDFMGFLTTREDTLTLGAQHNAVPAAEVIVEFLKARGIDQDVEPLVIGWEKRCSQLNLNLVERVERKED